MRETVKKLKIFILTELYYLCQYSFKIIEMQYRKLIINHPEEMQRKKNLRKFRCKDQNIQLIIKWRLKCKKQESD